ncbi:MAG TPA: NUDIX hydrolase [Bacteroidetes bacterium]|nr:NUDIX hydrolase [Bacteroidota bacterium]
MNIRKPRRLERSVIYVSDWVDLYADRVEFPDGRIIDRHHILEFHHDFIGAVVENDEGKILFVQAYRYPLDSLEWEIPTGRVEDGETLIKGAQREVLEESGYETTDHKLIYTFNPINGISAKRFHVVTCRPGLKLGEFDRNEIRAVRWTEKEEIGRLIRNRVLKDGFTLTALLLYLNGME